MKRFIQFITEEDEHIYHATSHEHLNDIRDAKKLKTHGPSHGTDQSHWPDGSKEKRSYWGTSEKHVAPFHPEHGKPVVLRAKKSAVEHHKERGTPDLYSKKPVHAKHLEYKHDDGTWKKVHE